VARLRGEGGERRCTAPAALPVREQARETDECRRGDAARVRHTASLPAACHRLARQRLSCQTSVVTKQRNVAANQTHHTPLTAPGEYKRCSTIPTNTSFAHRTSWRYQRPGARTRNRTRHGGSTASTIKAHRRCHAAVPPAFRTSAQRKRAATPNGRTITVCEENRLHKRTNDQTFSQPWHVVVQRE